MAREERSQHLSAPHYPFGMKNRLLILSAASLLALFFVACGDSSSGEPGTGDSDAGRQPGGADASDQVDGGSVEPADTGALCTEAGLPCEEDSECCGEFGVCSGNVCSEIACDELGEPPTVGGPGCCGDLVETDGICASPECEAEAAACVADAECCSGRCLLGECRVTCANERDCDDGNPCTLDSCIESDGVCRRDPLFGPLPDDEVGDCQIPICDEVQDENGDSYAELTYRADNEDLPVDDGIECYEETCIDGTPARFPNNEICDDGDPDTFEQCVPAEGGCVPGAPPSWYCRDAPTLEFFDTEQCNDGLDGDGDGDVDEDCECTYGDVQRCWSGFPQQRGVGGCLDGIQQCGVRSDPRWGTCRGQIVPQPEQCDNKDNDCNGCVDDLANCSPFGACPTEVEALPFAYYELDVNEFLGESGAGVELLEVQWAVIPPANSEIVGNDPSTPENESYNQFEFDTPVDDPNTDGIDESLIVSQARIFLDVSGDYQMEATIVTDKGTIVCSWIVRARGSGLRIELSWDTSNESDLDLHMHQYEADRPDEVPYPWFQTTDCYFNNQRPSWGYPGTPAEDCQQERNCNNPRLDIDNQGQFPGRPENVNVDNPRDGDTFVIMVHAWRLSALEPQKAAQLTVFCGGEQVSLLGGRPDEAFLADDQMWLVGTVTMEVDDTGRTTGCSVAPRFRGEGEWDVYDRNVELPE